MLEQPVYAADRTEVRALIADKGWATLVSGRPQPVVSHLPIILASDDADDLTVLGHLARRDAQLHDLGNHDAVLIVEGPEGYISPTWYAMEPYVPTWNFVVAHLHGRPEPLDAEETWSILQRTVEHFEHARPDPWRLETVEDYARSIAPQTTGFRFTPTRIVGKAKLNQDKPAEAIAGVIRGLETDPVHANLALAASMRAHGLSPDTNSVDERVGLPS